MNNTIAQVGNKGERVRSDCFVTLELTESGGLVIQPESKVKALFGKDILNLAREVLEFFGITDARLTIEDSGALSFVLAARIEAAVKKLVSTDKEFLPAMIPENEYRTARDRQRISRLYLPGNTPSLMINAVIHHPD